MLLLIYVNFCWSYGMDGELYPTENYVHIFIVVEHAMKSKQCMHRHIVW